MTSPTDGVGSGPSEPDEGQAPDRDAGSPFAETDERVARVHVAPAAPTDATRPGDLDARLHGDARQLAALERRRASQLRELADAALTMTATTDLEDMLRVVTESARDIIGTHQAVTNRLLHGWTGAWTYVSLSEKYAAWRDYDEVPKGLGVLEYVIRENRPLRLRPDELAAHPDWRGLRDSPGHPPLPDYLAAPLVGRDGRNLGLIQLSDKVDGTEFTAEDESMLVQLAQMASAAVENLALLENERAARQRAEEDARWRGLLSDASHAFARSLELDETLSTIVGTAVPALADWCVVQLRGDMDSRSGRSSGAPPPGLGESARTTRADSRGGIAVAALAATDPEVERSLRALVDRMPVNPEPPFGAAAAVRTGASAFLSPPPASGEDLRGLLHTGLCVPLPAGGEIIGAVTLAKLSGTPYSQTELEFTEDLARRAALAIVNATRYAAERQVAATVQATLLPQQLPMTADVSAAARYLPGSSGAQVGGDWYDIIDLGGGRIGLVIGDVMGRGVMAAAVMGQLRAALRAYAVEGHEPAEVLTRLDRLVQTFEEGMLTTCVYSVFDQHRRELTAAAAGHLPPLLVPTGEPPRFLTLDPGLPLGVGGAEYVQSTRTLPAGFTVLFYTDGLVEGPDLPVDEGMRRLREAAGDPARSAEALCDRALAALGALGNDDDDTALLAVAFSPASPELSAVGERVRFSMPSAPESIATTRAFVADVLGARGLGRCVDTAVLLVSELSTNALRHGYGYLQVQLQLSTERVRVEVSDESVAMPRLQDDVADDDEGGRGLFLVDVLATRWGCDPFGDGKTVWFELDLPDAKHQASA